MLDDRIAARTATQDQNRRIALNVQRIARFVAVPAAALMLLGLITLLTSGAARGQWQGQPVVPISELFSRTVLTPIGAMSVGLLALALLPMVNVLYILIDSLVHRRWTDAAAAAAVATILSVGILLGRA
jgi:hypothetical protein